MATVTTPVRVLDTLPTVVAGLAAVVPVVWGAWTSWVLAFGGVVPGIGARPDGHLLVGLGMLLVVTPLLALVVSLANHALVSVALTPFRALLRRAGDGDRRTPSGREAS